VVSESTPATPASVATMIENVFGSAMKYVAGRLTAATVSGAKLSARSASTTSSVTTLATVISVTTIPAAANVGVAAAYADWGELGGALAQLGINLTCLTVSGIVTLGLLRGAYERRRTSRSANAGVPARPTPSGTRRVGSAGAASSALLERQSQPASPAEGSRVLLGRRGNPVLRDARADRLDRDPGLDAGEHHQIRRNHADGDDRECQRGVRRGVASGDSASDVERLIRRVLAG
jgi:uncharacterized protein DUF389